MVNSIRIPPLRDRIDDIPLLAKYFLKMENERTGIDITGISDDLMDLLQQYSFPDNMQELRNIIAGAIVSAEGDTITPDSLSPYILERITQGEVTGGFTPMKLREAIMDFASKTMEYCGGDMKDAARLLGIPQDELDQYIEQESSPE